MDAGAAAFRAVHMQAPLSKIDLRPAKAAEFGGAEPVPIRQQDRASIPNAIPASLARSLDQPIDLCLRQILTRSVGGVGQAAQCSFQAGSPKLNSFPTRGFALSKPQIEIARS